MKKKEFVNKIILKTFQVAISFLLFLAAIIGIWGVQFSLNKDLANVLPLKPIYCGFVYISFVVLILISLEIIDKKIKKYDDKARLRRLLIRVK